MQKFFYRCFLLLAFLIYHHSYVIACSMVIEDFSLKPNFSVNDELGKSVSNAANLEELMPLEIETLELFDEDRVILNGYIFYLNRMTPGGRGVDCRNRFYREPIFFTDNFNYIHLGNIEGYSRDLKNCSGSELEFGLNEEDYSKDYIIPIPSAAKKCIITLEGTLKERIDPLAIEYPCAFEFEMNSNGDECDNFPFLSIKPELIKMKRYRMVLDIHFIYSLQKNTKGKKEIY